MKRKIVSLLLMVGLLISLFPRIAILASATVYSGNCGADGSNLTWTLDSETGVLTIEGSGAMKDYVYMHDGWGQQIFPDYVTTPWWDNRDKVLSVILPEGLSRIGKFAFYGCSQLTSVTIPDSVTTIGGDAFSGCTGMTGVYINDLVAWCGITVERNSYGNAMIQPPLYYAHNLYLNNELVTALTVPEGVISISNSLFDYCTSLKTVTFPQSLTSISEGSFRNCTGLKSIIFSNSITNIETSAFAGCTSLGSVILPDGVTSIGDGVFSGCTSLTSVTIPDSVTGIGNDAFNGCQCLNISIPNNVTSIGERAFKGVPKVTIDTTRVLANWFKNTAGLKELSVGPHVRAIETGAFSGCSALSKVKMAEGIETIGNQAFSGCTHLTEMTIPASVTSFGSNVFEGCTFLHELTIEMSEVTRNMLDCCYTQLSDVTITDPECLIEYEVNTLGVPGQTVIHGLAGSTAEKYALRFAYTFAAYSPEPPHEHDWGEPTYRWAPNNSTVTASRTCKLDASHVEAETVNTTSEITKPATCTVMGETTYTAAFTNPAFETQTKTVVDVEMAAHTPGEPVKENEVPPTCTEAGGFDSVVYCTVCGAEISRAHTEVDALGHAYVLTGWNWTGVTAASAVFTCQNDASHVLAVEATITGERTEPTEEADGSVVYTATVTFEGKDYTDTKTEILPALGKEYELTAWTWDGFVAASATFTEIHDGSTITAAATITAERTEPTCEDDGKMVYTASVTFNGADYNDTKTEPLPATGHHFENGVCIVCGKEDPDYVPPVQFTDVTEGAYYADAVAWAVANGVTNGTSTTTFSPANTCTRAQVVTFLWRAKGSPEPKSVILSGAKNPDSSSQAPQNDMRSANPFTDISETAYYYKAVLWAVENGITNGTSASTFGPNNGCTRAQVVTFLWRTEGEPEPQTTQNPFTDVTGGYYYKAVLWAVEQKITNGTSATTFGPNATCTRGQIVTFLYRDLAS